VKNQMIPLLLLYMLSRTKDENQVLQGFNHYIEGMEIDLEYTEEKIHLLKKITPLIPREYNPTLTKSIMITETAIKLLELKGYLNQSNSRIQSNIVPIKDNRERFNRIITTIQEEMPKSKTQNMGMVMDLIVNMDEYKKMFELLNTFMSNKDSMKDPESMVKLVEPLMKGKNQKGSFNPKEMEQIFNIMKVLNSTEKKEKPNES